MSGSSGSGEAGAPWAEARRPDVAPTAVRTGNRAGLHTGLFVLTLATTTWAGAAHQGVDLLRSPSDWVVGVPYALALLAILGVHEMGHYVVARRRGVHVSLPYFIPAPIWLGTFGAFIRMGGRIQSRSSYFDVGIAGPLAGLILALAALFFGLMFEPAEVAMDHGMVPACSFLFAGVYQLAGGTDLAAAVQLGPVAFAGWLGLMITALNLIPVGQLDGGHVAYAVLGRAVARRLSVGIVATLIGGGLLLGSHLWMWGLIAWAVAGTDHPPAGDESAPVSASRRWLAAGAVLLVLAIVLPVPIS